VAATQMLISDMEGQHMPGDAHRVFEPIVIPRESTLGRARTPAALRAERHYATPRVERHQQDAKRVRPGA